jgi:hypothetical protein
MRREKSLRKYFLNKKLFFIAALLFGGIVFTSCSGDKSEPQTVLEDELSPSTPPNPDAEAPVVVKSVPDNDPNLKEDVYTEKYDNGVIKIKGYVLGGKRDGEWMSWYSNGKPWSACTYRAGILNGPIQTWYENGQKRFSGSYMNGKRSGKWTFWKENGELDNEKNF